MIMDVVSELMDRLDRLVAANAGTDDDDDVRDRRRAREAGG
jgi:hypothetical protein